MTELQIGEEYDRQALRRLKDALRSAGAKRVGSFQGVFGSQEISNATFSVANGRLRVEVETYVGITVSGDDEAIESLSRHL